MRVSTKGQGLVLYDRDSYYITASAMVRQPYDTEPCEARDKKKTNRIILTEI